MDFHRGCGLDNSIRLWPGLASRLLQLTAKDPIRGEYVVKDGSGQALAYVYARETRADADIANVLTMDEARASRAISPSCRGGCQANRCCKASSAWVRHLFVAKFFEASYAKNHFERPDRYGGRLWRSVI